MNSIMKLHSNLKFKKVHHRSINKKKVTIVYGFYAIVSRSSGTITEKQISNLELFMKKRIKKYGKYWLTLSLNLPITKKPIGSRMGKGTGAINHWAHVVQPNSTLIEFDKNTPLSTISYICTQLKYKLNLKLYIISK